MNLWIGAAIVGGMTVGTFAGPAMRRYLRRARDDRNRRPALWELFYSIDWGDTTTNNYGYAPARSDHPQRFQHEMYLQLLDLLRAKKHDVSSLSLLEVSCGRGGGLNILLEQAPGLRVTGLDIAGTAIEFCRQMYGETERLRFVQGSAMDLPFADSSFDVVLNVEASNDYGDRRRFFHEVARVLKPGGVFLYADTFRVGRREEMERDLAAAGFAAALRDITANVVEACRLDTPRRVQVIHRHAPKTARLLFRRQLENYAAIEGSKKFLGFQGGQRGYVMTAATRG